MICVSKTGTQSSIQKTLRKQKHRQNQRKLMAKLKQEYPKGYNVYLLRSMKHQHKLGH